MEVNDKSTTNIELYLLLIVIKLSIAIAFKVIQGVIHLYSRHNKRIIKHHNTQIAKIQRITSAASENLEAGLSGQQK